MEDVEAIAGLIEHYAAEGLLLARSREEIRAGLDRFLIVIDGGKIAGCVALEGYGTGLAEIRSIAVDPAAHGKGLGARLLRAAMEEAQRRGYARVFAMTQTREFFLHHGFRTAERETLPEKIERDCRQCPHAAGCRLEAVATTVVMRQASLPAPSRKPVLPLLP
jgi:amino-acid N-acetyltransferase